MVISINYPLSTAIGAYTSEARADTVSQSSLVTQQSPLTSITLDPLAALRRIETSTVTQLSSYGQVKSSLADLQDKARALKNLNQPPTLSDFKGVVQAFVQSFNSITQTVNNLTSKKGALNTEDRPSQALNDIRKAVGGPKGNAFSSLKELGISQQTDGTFAIDRKQLEKSFKDNPKDALSTVSDLASRVMQTTDKLLSDKGTIGKKVNDLSARVSELEGAQSTVQGYLDTPQEPKPPPAIQPSGGYTARIAVDAYVSVASF
jgi:flagellar capping protein FliD